jgi:hypothetical protein
MVASHGFRDRPHSRAGFFVDRSVLGLKANTDCAAIGGEHPLVWAFSGFTAKRP